MTQKQFEAIGKKVLDGVLGYSAVEDLVVARPINRILRGLCFEGSSFSKEAFYVWVFFQPLYIPAEHLNFSLGKRIDDRWIASDPDAINELTRRILQSALPLLNRFKTPQEISDAITALRVYPDDPHVKQAIAYSYARCGKIPEAVKSLRELLDSLNQSVPWQKKMHVRGTDLERKLLSDSTAATKQLDEWEDETVKNLKLERFR